MWNPPPNRSGEPETGRNVARRIALTGVLAVSVACSPAPGSSAIGTGELPAARSAAAPTAVPKGPRVVLPSGAVISLEVARTEAEKSQGLMFRESMPKDAGMVFLFEGLEIRPFWMKDCHFPLDMIYTLKDGTIVDVLKDVPACKADPCPSFPPKAKADTVVEVNAGIATKFGAVPGAKLIYREVPER